MVTTRLRSRRSTQSGNWASDSISVDVDNAQDLAVYHATYRAPACLAASSRCDSGDLLDGRANVGPESNAPNTLYGSCADGTSGNYHSDESIDRILVYASAGSTLTAGSQATVEVTVWSWNNGSADHLDLYYTADADDPSPDWTHIGTYSPGGGGQQVITATYTLPAGNRQALRANFRYNGAASFCSTGNYDDHDDLVFSVTD